MKLTLAQLSKFDEAYEQEMAKRLEDGQRVFKAIDEAASDFLRNRIWKRVLVFAFLFAITLSSLDYRDTLKNRHGQIPQAPLITEGPPEKVAANSPVLVNYDDVAHFDNVPLYYYGSVEMQEIPPPLAEWKFRPKGGSFGFDREIRWVWLMSKERFYITHKKRT